MGWVEVVKSLFGVKTEAEKEAEARFVDAMDRHRKSNGEVKELRLRLQRARADARARIGALSAGGSDVDGREITEAP